MHVQAEQEFCINCTRWVDYLLPNTGWCKECSGVTENTKQVCVRCKSVFRTSEGAFICDSCKQVEWANEVEQLMVIGRLSYNKAKSLVAKNNQATCLCCGEVMPRATKGRHLFCKSHQKCKSASRRVKHLRLAHYMTHEEALTQVLKEVHSVDGEVHEQSTE